MHSWFYFARPSHSAFHDLRSNKTTNLPANIKSLLGLSLKFCPTPRYTTDLTTINTTTNRHLHDLRVKHFFMNKSLSKDFNPRLHVKSKWTPPPWGISSELERRFNIFKKRYKILMRRKRGRSNLLPHHRSGLRTLQASTDTIIVQCDKNLGPACIDIPSYINFAFRDHLNDNSTYKYLSRWEALSRGSHIRQSLTSWIQKWQKCLSKSELKFIRSALTDKKIDAISTFYLLMKVHKTPLKTRPIVSCSGTLLYYLGIWVDDKLQRVAKNQRSYFKSSFDLKDDITSLKLPPNASIFTADAISMYTNINTTHALRVISTYLRQNKARFPEIPVEALIEALRLIMRNNVFRFGDTHWLQISGTAMGTPPAPPYATLYFAIHEEILLEEFKDNLLFYRRYIDDVFGVWLTTNDASNHQWETFKQRMNGFGLEWDVNERNSQVDFMDLTISINGDRLTTTLYEKAMNLYLYIPPHSSHPPGVLTGLIYGNIFRIQRLCSEETDKSKLKKQFFQRLLVRGYKPADIKPVFEKAESNAIKKQQQKQKSDMRDTVFLHLPFHPDNPRSGNIQKIWQEHMVEPQNKQHIRSLIGGSPRLIIAYSRPRNLGNLLSSRNLNTHNGPPVSSYRIRESEGGH
jgi:hypothetical protein